MDFKVILGKEGEKVNIGQLLLTIDEGTKEKEVEEVEAIEKEEKKRKKEEKKETKAEIKEEEEVKKEKEEEKVKVKAKEEKEKLIDKAAPKEQQGEIVEFSRSAKTTTESKPSRGFAPAAPSVRRLAREIGIDISEVPGSGPGGRISEEDVKNYARQLLTETSSIRSTGH